MSSDFLNALRKAPLVGIARGLPVRQASDCARMCMNSGLKFIEVPLNTPAAAEALADLVAECQPLGIYAGAGTVRSKSDLDCAIAAGAQFIVSPSTVPEIVQICAERGLPCFPGALTPTEIDNAYHLGATAVKVFPIGAMGGVSYIKELRGPFRDIPLLACGGVNPDNAAAYLQAGCDFLAFGGSIFSPALMEGGQWDAIHTKISALRLAAGL